MKEATYDELQANYNATKATAEAAYRKVGINEQIAANTAHKVAKALYEKRLIRMLMS